MDAAETVISILRKPHASSAEPMRLAETFRKTMFQMIDDPTLVRWARAWWRYDGVRYVEHDDETLARDIIGFLDVVEYDHFDPKTKAKSRKRITARRSTLTEVKSALLKVMPILEGGAPQWTERHLEDPDPSSLVPCGNGLLDLRERKVFEPTPRLFSTQSLGAGWDPEATAPNWLAFLDSLWGEDRDSIRALQQLFGYLVSPDTDQHKLFAIVGPKRSGKSTIGRIVKALLGDDSTVNPTLSSLEKQFGMAPLVGKTVAIIGDARLGGKADQAAVVERLLSISGEDPISIDRKNRDPINVRLRTRVLLLSNELPRLYDTSGALASRFLILQTSRSFYGEEDLQLERRLLAELPGILAWAVEGYHDLLEQGRFTIPAASQQAQAELEAISSPITVFLEDVCKVGAEYEIECALLYERYSGWCEKQGREPGNMACFGRDLRSVHPAVQVVQRRGPTGGRSRFYQGVSLV